MSAESFLKKQCFCKSCAKPCGNLGPCWTCPSPSPASPLNPDKLHIPSLGSRYHHTSAPALSCLVSYPIPSAPVPPPNKALGVIIFHAPPTPGFLYPLSSWACLLLVFPWLSPFPGNRKAWAFGQRGRGVSSAPRVPVGGGHGTNHIALHLSIYLSLSLNGRSHL